MMAATGINNMGFLNSVNQESEDVNNLEFLDSEMALHGRRTSQDWNRDKF